MHYQTFEPASELSAFIKCYWTLESDGTQTAERQTIVPDGCAEMIFHYGDLYRQYITNKESFVQPRCFVFGQLTRPLEIEPTGATGIFAVRFHPEGFGPFSTLPMKEFENNAVTLEKIFGKDGVSLSANVLQAKTTGERILLVETFLSKRIDHESVDRTVKSVVETILMTDGHLHVDKLSDQIQINRRQLERKFSAAIGLSPKQLSKTIRLQATLRLLLSGKFTSFTDLAYEGDYYDQAHFIKDFKEFTGLTPREFFRESTKMSSLFYGTD